MDKNKLNLGGLTMDDIDFSSVRGCMDKFQEEKKEYKAKYGDDWWDHYLAENSNRSLYSSTDTVETFINDAIYNGHIPFMNGTPDALYEVKTKYSEKMKRLFGRSWKKHVNHLPNDLKVNKLLIKDALKSGKWEELPKELHEEYHRLAGD